VVGRGAGQGRVELVCRADGSRQDLPVEEAMAALRATIPAARLGLEPAPGPV